MVENLKFEFKIFKILQYSVYWCINVMQFMTLYYSVRKVVGTEVYMYAKKFLHKHVCGKRHLDKGQEYQKNKHKLFY